MQRRWILIACALFGCRSTPERLAPALIVGDSTAAVTEIAQVMAMALEREVQLAPDAFSASSLVTLEHSPRQTIGGAPATGMLTEKPEQFELVRSPSGCAIRRLRTGEVLALPNTQCRLANEPGDHAEVYDLPGPYRGTAHEHR